MRAVTYEQFGAADDVLNVENIPTPDPGEGEVLVRLKSSGINPSDVKVRAGSRPGVTKPPFAKIIPHSDGAGIIEAVGEGCSRSRIGDPVWIYNGQWQRAFGTASEYIVVPENQVVALPENVSFEIGAVLGIPATTACYAVLKLGPLMGKSVLISGGGGSVGRLAVQFAKLLGANVFATVGQDAARNDLVSLGIDKVFDYKSEYLAEEILDANGGKPIDFIIEVEFGKNAETNATVIAEHGRIVTYGSAKDMAPTLPFYPLMFKAVSIETILVYILTNHDRNAVETQLAYWLEKDVVNFQISDIFNLDQCAEAHKLVESGTRSGSVILRM